MVSSAFQEHVSDCSVELEGTRLEEEMSWEEANTVPGLDHWPELGKWQRGEGTWANGDAPGADCR